MTNDVDEFLEHHGIKGQKWGVRNKSNAHEAFRKTGKGKGQAKVILNNVGDVKLSTVGEGQKFAVSSKRGAVFTKNHLKFVGNMTAAIAVGAIVGNLIGKAITR